MKSKGSVVHRTAEYTPPHSWQTWLIGRPLQTADAPHQTIGKAIGLAVFASDALSSTAYATQEILIILAAAGSAAQNSPTRDFNPKYQIKRICPYFHLKINGLVLTQWID